MAKALYKVQKQISKKRVGKGNALHVNSRDAQRLRAAGAREDKLSKLMTATTRANESYVDRTAWFRSAMETSSGPLSDEDLHALTQSYIQRDDDELATLKAQRRKGRPPSADEGRLTQMIDSEQREFRAGFWVPDLRDEDSRLRLERWSGDWAGMNALKFVRVVESGSIRPSSFPPKGQS